MSGIHGSGIASRLKQTMKKPFKPPFKSSFALASADRDEDVVAPERRNSRKPVSKAPSPVPYREDSPSSRAIPNEVPFTDKESGMGVIEIGSESEEEAGAITSTPLAPTEIELDASFSTKFPVSGRELISSASCS